MSEARGDGTRRPIRPVHRGRRRRHRHAPRLEVFPREDEDGAPAHHSNRDTVWVAALQEMGLENRVVLCSQPANSPDTNILDLGFFNSLQSRHWLENPSTAVEIIEMVRKTFTEHPPALINRIWLSCQQCLNEIIDNNGSNDHRLGHMGKKKLEREN